MITHFATEEEEEQFTSPVGGAAPPRRHQRKTQKGNTFFARDVPNVTLTPVAEDVVTTWGANRLGQLGTGFFDVSKWVPSNTHTHTHTHTLKNKIPTPTAILGAPEPLHPNTSIEPGPHGVQVPQMLNPGRPGEAAVGYYTKV